MRGKHYSQNLYEIKQTNIGKKYINSCSFNNWYNKDGAFTLISIIFSISYFDNYYQNK